MGEGATPRYKEGAPCVCSVPLWQGRRYVVSEGEGEAEEADVHNRQGNSYIC